MLESIYLICSYLYSFFLSLFLIVSSTFLPFASCSLLSSLICFFCVSLVFVPFLLFSYCYVSTCSIIFSPLLITLYLPFLLPDLYTDLQIETNPFLNSPIGCIYRRPIFGTILSNCAGNACLISD